MSNFSEAFVIVKENEGNKLTNDKNDKGGLTNAGITFPFYKERCERVFEMKPSLPHFKSLSNEAKIALYQSYWDELKMDAINSDLIAAFVFDFCVNSGGAIREIQKMLNNIYKRNVLIDNVLGRETISEINLLTNDAQDIALLYAEMKLARMKYLWDLGMKDKTQRDFWAGWFKRVLFFGN